MSATSEVFVDSPLDIDDFTLEIVQILDANFSMRQDPFYPYGLSVDAANMRCYLGKNNYELYDLTQQMYRYVLDIFPLDVDADERADALVAGALYVFEKLKVTDRFPVMATFYLQDVLAEHIPDKKG